MLCVHSIGAYLLLGFQRYVMVKRALKEEDPNESLKTVQKSLKMWYVLTPMAFIVAGGYISTFYHIAAEYAYHDFSSDSGPKYTCSMAQNASLV